MDIKAFLSKQKKEQEPKEEPVQIDSKVTEYVNGLPQQNFTLAPKQKPKTDQKPIIITASIVGVLLVACILAFVLWPKGGSANNNNPTPQEEIVEEEPEDEEDEETLNAKLAQKFNSIMSFGLDNTSEKSAVFWTTNNNTETYTKLTFNERLYISSNLVSKTKANVSVLKASDLKNFNDDSCNKLFKRTCSNTTDDTLDVWGKLDFTKVKETYTNLFGAWPEETVFTEIDGCPSIYYISEADTVLYVGQCGSAPTVSVSTYQYKYSYSIDDRYAYIYFAAATIKPHENGSVYDMYSDLYLTDFVRTLDDRDYKITDKNYDNFKHYRMTFYKSDHNFIYKNIIEAVDEEEEEE